MGSTSSKDEKQNQITEKQIQRQRLISARLRALDQDDAANPEKESRAPQFERTPSLLGDFELKMSKVKPEEYIYPFENIVLEGGGVKGLGYCGAIRVLEELGIYKQIKRFAGASAGAMAAALLVAGYNSYDLEEFLGQDLEHLFLDAPFGIMSLLPNLLSGYGWNPGNRFYEWIGTTLAKKIGNPDISFKQLYKKTGKELCVVVTNLNHMKEEFCHVKTTPDMSVRLAIRMSMGIPGLFQATTYTRLNETNTYVDGGMLCNYPVHSFDGWWLSMKPEDSFLQKLQPLEKLPTLLAKQSRFKECNNKTLGFLLYAETDNELFRYSLESRNGNNLSKFPDTELARKKLKKITSQKIIKREHRRVLGAVNEFLTALRKSDIDLNGNINKQELENALQDEAFTEQSREILFGKDADITEIFNSLDTDGGGEIECHELYNFVQSTGVILTERYLGYQKQDITGLVSFFDSLRETYHTNVKRLFLTDRDLDRTVGINTGHVGTSDFKLEIADKKYAVEQGRIGTLAFLRYYVVRENLPCARGPADKDNICIREEGCEEE